MYKTRHGLAADTREQIASLLQHSLNSALDLRLATKQAHWAVRDRNFIALHELFDGFVAPLDEEIDQIAERIAALGAVPNGVVQAVAAASALSPYPADAVAGSEHLTALADRFAELGNTVREQIDQTADLGDADTSDLLTGFSRMLDQSLWFLEAHLTD